VFKLTPAQFGLGGLATLGATGAGFLLSKEKKKAQNKVETFKSQDIKDWDKFTENTARKSFIQELGKDPMTDPKLLMYADNMNRLKTGSKVQDISGDGGKSYQITKLRGSNRLGCTCNDWRYKRSVAQPGEEQDCKHIKQYRQMSKTAGAPYEEEGSFTHDGKRYSLQEAFQSARVKPTKQVPVDDLKWVLAYDRPDPARLAAADLTTPVLVAPDRQGRPTVIDGLHRLTKAVQEGQKTIPAKILPLEALKTAASDKAPRLTFITGGAGAGKSTMAQKLIDSGEFDVLIGTDTGRVVNGQYVKPPKAEREKIRKDREALALKMRAKGKRVLVEGFPRGVLSYPKLLEQADDVLYLDTPMLTRLFRVGKRSRERGTPMLPDLKMGLTTHFDDLKYRKEIEEKSPNFRSIRTYEDAKKEAMVLWGIDPQMSKTAASSFKDTLPNPVIDGKPHSGTWTIVGSGRLSIPKKTSDIDYMVPLEEVKDLSGFQEYADVPGVYWRDSETIDGRPSTIVALPRYAYDKIDDSYQQATDRFGKRKLRQLKKTLPKDSFYKDIGVVYTSDAMKKEGGHVEDRIAERAPGAEAEVNTLRAKLDQIKLRKGQTYHVPLSRGKGYAVIGDVGNRHVVKTVLGPSMRPPGERLTNLSNYRKIEVSGKEVLLDKEIPLIIKLPKDTTKLVKFLTDRAEKAKSSRWSHGQIAIPSSVNLENLPQAVKTRWAIPLPGERVGTPTIRIGRLHAHTSDPVHVIHLDSHAPEGIKSVLKHVPEAVRAAKTLILDKPDPFLKDARAPRDYKREYAQYHAKPDQVENRSLRNQARRKLGLKKGDPREADHKTPLSKGGGNGHANLRAVSRTTNRTKFTGDT
jgi:hypothetical protein